MPILLADDSVIKNSKFPPMFVPFNTVPGCIAAWRGDFSKDVTGNGHVLTKVGNPNQSVNTVLCNKDNGYITDIPDGPNRTLVVIFRNVTTVAPPNQTYSNPIGNLSQIGTGDGVGIGIVQSTAVQLDLNQFSACVGADKKGTTLFSKAMAPQDKPVTNSLKWTWAAFTVDGDSNVCNLYIPSIQDSLIRGVNNGGVQLKNRWMTNQDGSPAPYRIGCWRDPSTPGTASSSVEIAYAAFYDRALLLPDLRQQHGYDMFYAAQIDATN